MEARLAKRKLSLPEREAFRMRLRELLADLDMAEQWLVAAHVSGAIDALEASCPAER